MIAMWSITISIAGKHFCGVLKEYLIPMTDKYAAISEALRQAELEHEGYTVYCLSAREVK